MEPPVAIEDDREVVYDIELRRGLPDALRSQFPGMSVRTCVPETALRRRVGEPAQLDALLHKLCSVGVVLTDVHRVPSVAQTDGTTYEVRVAGELGQPLLRYLSWPHAVVPQRTQVRLALGPADLRLFLRACTDWGAGIERVRRVRDAARSS
jgi:hypothetical protein